MLAKASASHPDDRHAVLDSLACHSCSSALGTRFPEIVVNAVGGEQPAEGHFDFIADPDLVRLAVGHLAQKSPTALEIDYHVDRRRVERISQAIKREGGDAGGAIGERVCLHPVAHPTLHAYALRRKLRS